MAATEHYGALAPVRVAGARHASAPQGLVNGDLKVLWQDRQQLASGVEINSKLYLADLDWDAILDPDLSKIHFDDAGTGQSFDIGDANDPDALVDGQDIATAAGSCSLMKTVGIEKYGDPLWKLLGYATRKAALATGPRARIYLTVLGANLGAATDFAWKFVGALK